MNNKILNKIKNLNHQLEYLKKIYPGCSKISRIKQQIYYYRKKLASLYD